MLSRCCSTESKALWRSFIASSKGSSRVNFLDAIETKRSRDGKALEHTGQPRVLILSPAHAGRSQPFSRRTAPERGSRASKALSVRSATQSDPAPKASAAARAPPSGIVCVTVPVFGSIRATESPGTAATHAAPPPTATDAKPKSAKIQLIIEPCPKSSLVQNRYQGGIELHGETRESLPASRMHRSRHGQGDTVKNRAIAPLGNHRLRLGTLGEGRKTGKSSAKPSLSADIANSWSLS